MTSRSGAGKSRLVIPPDRRQSPAPRCSHSRGISVPRPALLSAAFSHERSRSADGAAFGPEPLLTQSAALRFHNKSDDVDGLYFVGAGTHPGAGVPGVLSSARVLDKLVPAPQNAQLPRGALARGKSAA